MERARLLIAYAPVSLHFLSFFVTVIWFCHVIACLFIFIARFEDFSSQTWVGETTIDPSNETQIYVAALYYILATLTTIGYGDIHPESIPEKVFVMLVMLFGVFLYSYTLGTLINVWKNQHSSKIQYRKRMRMLNSIDSELNIDGIMFSKLRRAIRIDADRSMLHKKKLFEELPTHLRTELIVIMNEKLVQRIPFFLVGSR